MLLDIWMPDTDGVTLLREWAAAGQLTMPVVMMSGHGTIETAVEATTIGAFDFLEKPIGLAEAAVDDRARAEERRGAEPRRVSLAALGTGAAGARRRARARAAARRAQAAAPARRARHRPRHRRARAAAPDAPWVALADGSRLTANPLALLEEAREGMLYCAEIGQYSKIEQKGLAFLLPKLEKYERDAGVHERRAARQPRGGGQVRRRRCCRSSPPAP